MVFDVISPKWKLFPGMYDWKYVDYRTILHTIFWRKEVHLLKWYGHGNLLRLPWEVT